jgi:gamma-glutamyl phosphate reductase
MAKKAKMTLKTDVQRAKDLEMLTQAKDACCDAVVEFSSDLWNSEWKVKYISLSVFNSVDDAADLIKCARTHLLEEYVTDDWSKLNEDERRNATHTHYYR